MVLSEKETTVIDDLKTQEQSCVTKYRKYAKEANDKVLKDLFNDIADEEEKHLNSLNDVLFGSVPKSDCNDSKGKNYSPNATYVAGNETEEKKNDCFLVTDCIGTEKLVSSEYNSNVFCFENSDIRKLLADIQVEEQNHAEMLYKYKTVNGMK